MIGQDYYEKVKLNWDSLLKPLDALGDFEEVICRLGAIQKNDNVELFPSALLVFCSDNGIIAEKVAQSDEKVTEDVTVLLGQHKSSVCHMAKDVGVDVFPVNLGVKNTNRIDGVNNDYYISPGTLNFAVEPAMSKSQFDLAFKCGADMVYELQAKGYKNILLGEMGIGNTTTSTAVIAAALGIEPATICGRGSGLSTEGLNNKIDIIRKSISKYELFKADIYTILRTVGGYDIVAMVGTICKAYELSVPIILDGLITAAAAVCAFIINPEIKDILFFSHKGKEQGIMVVADYIGVKPLIDGNLALGEGTGAVMYLNLLKPALAVYNGKTMFSSINMESYERFL